MQLDDDGQLLNARFNAKRNKEKAVYGLKGILLGVTADAQLNEQELLFFDVWLRSQQYLRNDSDVLDLLDLIGDILKDGRISRAELEDLHCLIDDTVKYKELPFGQEESQINELMGFISGIAADNTINSLELSELTQWLELNANIAEMWPASEIIKRLHLILADGVVTKDEREDLLETIKQITGNRFEDTGLAHGTATEFFEDEEVAIEHEGRRFCFTGKFVTGSRKLVEDVARKKGAATSNNVTKTTDYLVIGTMASRDWRFSSHGRKIEKALKFKNEGCTVVIVTERTWLKYSGI